MTDFSNNIVIDTENDEYSNKRKENYGKCSTCNRYNTNCSWCQSCDPQLLTQGWTSGNKAIDELIMNTQLEAESFENAYYLEWISFDKFKHIEEIGKGGFSTIYIATWTNGMKYINISSNQRRCKDQIVALKRLDKSQNGVDKFLKELSNYLKFEDSFSNVINIYGISQHPKTKEYIMVMPYAEDGNLHKYLKSEFEDIKWSHKIFMLSEIISGLREIHLYNILHHDFHSGNILKISSRTVISDLGLSIPADSLSSPSPSDNNNNDGTTNSIYGVLPYIAPEVLRGKPYTLKSDIYSFGVIMSEISTGRQPFSDLAHNGELALNITEGLRPEFSCNTPKFYIELAWKCMNADPDKRPTADDIYSEIHFWLSSFNYDDLIRANYMGYSKEQLKELKSIEETFDKMDKIKFNNTTATTHQYASYTSRLWSFTNLPKPVNSNKVTIIGDYHDSNQIELTIPDETYN